ncbi:uncharacterized protein LOC132271136 [Cornus florida]|uniref:uncharacterized protein LOC132271136 n=1 Tax=Cornus florida TaxID=4283 RepID=UPI0028974C99|nr:uncharacterized protein LOC132271136 [Cornus florida]
MAEIEPKREPSAMASGDQEPKKPNPFFSLFQKPPFSDFFPFKREATEKKSEASVSEKPATTVVEKAEESKRVAVKFPDTRPEIPPLKLEAEEGEQNTNPVVLWQVYAVGGFFILKWLWARWNERRINKRSSDEEPSPDDDN